MMCATRHAIRQLAANRMLVRVGRFNMVKSQGKATGHSGCFRTGQDLAVTDISLEGQSLTKLDSDEDFKYLVIRLAVN